MAVSPAVHHIMIESLATSQTSPMEVDPTIYHHKHENIRETPLPSVLVRSTKSAFRGKIKTERTEIPHSGGSLRFLKKIKREVKDTVRKSLIELGPLKCKLNIRVEMTRLYGANREYLSSWFSTKLSPILNTNEFEEFWLTGKGKIIESIDAFLEKGSGWKEHSVSTFQVETCKYAPLSASSHVYLPPILAKRKAIINIQNKDQKCFTWSVLCGLNCPSTNPQRVSWYHPRENQLNMSGIKYPVAVKDIPKFEIQNQVAVNVFGFEENQVYPVRITKMRNIPLVNLLLISNEHTTHYCYIKDFNRLMHSNTKNRCKAYYCFYCLHRFHNEETLKNHKPLCSGHDAQKVRLPERGKNDVLEFKNHKFKERVPFTIYADFECFNAPAEASEEGNTEVLTNHVPSSFVYVVVRKGKVIRKVEYLDRDGLNNVSECFLSCLLDEEEKIKPLLEKIVPIKMTPRDKTDFKNAVNCHICSHPLHEDRVRDHCHQTGAYRGAAHNKCNLEYWKVTHIPVFFHNLAYDSKLLLPALGNKELKGKLSCIPRSLEKYISFSWRSFRFLDSFQFLPSSLDMLVANLGEGNPSPAKFPITSAEVEHFECLTRKGVFMYEYMSDPSKFSETCLPPKENFYNTMRQEHISDADYAHAKHVWTTFGLKDLGEYQSLYNMSDVLLLADVFENFRNLSLEYYEIDPCHVYTTPGLTWEACLKKTQVKLELLTDIDQHLFIESSIRGGVSMITQRGAYANNPYMGVDYNPSEPNKYIMYLDANNLYGTAMTAYLPEKNFRWLTDTQNFDIMSIPDDGDTGYFLEVDLKYPPHLHDAHNCYPLAPEHLCVDRSMLSPYSLDLLEELSAPLPKVKKLCPNLADKCKYVVHYLVLKQYVALGLKITQIHRVLEFKQSQWVKPYVLFNTQKRMQARSSFEKDFFKLMVNSLYGKTIENLRNRCNVELITDEKRAQKVFNSPSLKNFHIVNENLVVACKTKPEIFLNRPIYVGSAILDISKFIMYDFHYHYMKAKYGEGAKLLFTDTDSLTYEIHTDDVYADMLGDLEVFDTSDYPPTHPLYSTRNKKVLGKFKDELNGDPIVEFIGLRAKMYSLVTVSEKSKQVGKGIARVTLKKSINHEDYVEALLSQSVKSADMYFIRNYRHQMSSIRQNKTTLSPFDDKRWIEDDGVYTLAHFHARTGVTRK